MSKRGIEVYSICRFYAMGMICQWTSNAPFVLFGGEVPTEDWVPLYV